MSAPSRSQETTAARERGPHHLNFIDALRGLAALYVVCFHQALVPHPNLPLPAWASPFILQGGSGVTLFFVVSAFTLSLSLHSRAAEPQPVKRFYLRRVFRIVPLYYLWLILSLVRDRVMSGPPHSLKEILLVLFFGYNFFPGKTQGIVWASWTLGVEMVFYLLFPLFFRYVNSVWKSFAFYAGTLFLCSGFHALVFRSGLPETEKVLYFHFSLLHNLPTFALGIAAYFIYERWIHGHPRRSWAALALIGGATLGYGILLMRRLPVFIEDWQWQAVVYTALLLGLAITPFRLFVNRVTRFYGKISYSLYLNHPTLVMLLTPLYLALYRLPIPVTLRYGFSLLLTLTILTPLSYITYRFIEEPGIRKGSQIIKRLAGRPHP